MEPEPSVSHFVSTDPYLLQEDVFVDDSLVPLRVQAPAGVFGSPLVFSTGKRDTS